MKLHGKAPVFAQVEGLLRVGHEQTRLDNGLARLLALSEGLAHDSHGKSVVLYRMGLDNGQILPQRLNKQLRFRDFLRIVFQRFVLHFILHGGVVGFQHFQLRHLHIQLHLLPDTVVSGSQGLDLGIGEGGGVHILSGPGGGFAGHNLTDEFLLVLHQPPVVGVKGALGDVLEHFDRFVHVALAQRPTGSLLQISGPPWAVKVMRRHNAVLDVGASSHFLGAADQYPNLPPAYLGEQLRLLRFGVGVVNKSDLLRGNPLGDQLGLNIVIDVEFAVVFGGREVAENKLGPPNVRAVTPLGQDILDTGIDLAVRVVRQEGILQTLVQSQLAAIRGDFQHIVLVRLHFSVPHGLRPFAQLRHHFLLKAAGFGGDGDVLRLRGGELQHIRRLNVSGLFPDVNKLREIVEFGEPGLGTKARALRLQLHSRDLLAKIRRPVVKMAVSVFHQRVELEIAHHGI